MAKYVSSVFGNDSNPGTELKPWKTLQYASSSVQTGDILYLDGTFRENVNLAPNGTEFSPTTYKTWPGKNPAIWTALEVVSNWTVYSGSIWKATVSSSWVQPQGKNLLFWNGTPLSESKYPINSNDPFPSTINALTANNPLPNKGQYSGINLPVNIPTSAKICFGGGARWGYQHGSINTISINSVSFTYSRNPEFGDALQPSNNDPFFIWGAIELLQPGQFFVQGNFVYLKTPDASNPNNAIIEMKARKVLCNPWDSPTATWGKQNLKFEGIKFVGAPVIMGDESHNWNFISCIFNYNSYSLITNSNLMADNYFEDNQVFNGVNLLIDNCVFYWFYGAIILAGTNIVFSNNTVSDINLLGVNQSAIGIGTSAYESKNVQIKNCSISRCGRSGTGIYNAKDSLIENNQIFDYCKKTRDNGGIYLWGGTVTPYNFGATRITKNKIWQDNSDKYNTGIYCDHGVEGCDFIIDHNEVTLDNSNTLPDTSSATIRIHSPARNVKVYNNTCVTNGNKSGNGFSLWGNSSIFQGICIKNNIFTHPNYGGVPSVIDKMDVKDIQDINLDISNNIYSDTDPCFVDRSNKDYNPLPNSSAINKGVAISPYTDGFSGAAPDCGAIEFTMPISPTVTSIVPSSAEPGQSITINGINFSGQAIIKINGITTTTNVLNATTINVTVPDLQPGSQALTLTQDNIVYPINTSFSVLPRSPVINSIVPNSIELGNAITLSGSNFTAGAKIKIGTTEINTVFLGSNTLSATIPTNLPTGNVSGFKLIQNNIEYQFNNELSLLPIAPIITSASPSSGQPGEIITVTGNNFSQEINCLINGTSAVTNYISPTQVNLVIPSNLASGTGNIVISQNSYSYPINNLAISINPITPIVSSIFPDIVQSGDGLTILGSHFNSSIAAFIDGILCPIINKNEFSMQISVPSLSIGTKSIVLRQDGVDYSFSNISLSLVESTFPTPVITSITPIATEPGQTIIIMGENFDSSISVKFREVNIAPTFINQSEIRAIVPQVNPGTFTLLINQHNTTYAGIDFTALAVPRIDTLNPLSIEPGQVLTISGSNFDNCEIKINGQIIPIIIESPTSIKATIPLELTTGLFDISLLQNNIEHSFTRSLLRILPLPPVITSITPATVNVGDYIDIYGKFLTNDSSVTFNNNINTPITIIDETHARVQVPDLQTGNGNLKIITATGISNICELNILPVILPPPTITTISSTTFFPGQSILISGTNFIGNEITATIGGIPCAINITSNNNLSILIPSIEIGNNNLQIFSKGQQIGNPVSVTVIKSPDFPVISTIASEKNYPGNIVTITGINFQENAIVYFGNTQATETFFVNNNTIKAVIPTIQPQLSYITVHSGNEISNLKSFVISSLPIHPEVISVEPKEIQTGKIINITGNGFSRNVQVFINGNEAAIVYYSPSLLKVQIP